MSAEPGPQPAGSDPESAKSHLFMLRLWRAPLGEHLAEWRGSLNYVTTGETRYFHAWPALLAHLQALLGLVPDPPPVDPPQVGRPAPKPEAS